MTKNQTEALDRAIRLLKTVQHPLAKGPVELALLELSSLLPKEAPKKTEPNDELALD